MFWFNRSKKKLHIPSVDTAPAKQHRKAIQSIEDTSTTVKDLKKILVENGITIQIARAAGGKHDGY